MPADRSNDSHHQRALERLAREAQVPASVVARLYEHVRAELEMGARIKGFLGILALRKVRKILRQRETSSSVSPVRLSSLPGGKSK
jgi:Protein of unknown function (DUF3562)